MSRAPTPLQLEMDRNCLAYEPFEGDRDTDVRLLADRFVTSRVVHVCNVCQGAILPGLRVRARSEVYDGQVGTFYFCPDCCAAMACSWDDDGHAIEARHTLGWERSQAGRKKP